jgi:WD40 repeat protein/lipocalin
MTEHQPDLTQILKEFDALQERVSKLENNGTNEIQSQNHIKVNDDLELSKVPRLDLSESKLVELYNECPQILELTAIRVNLTADSYRQSDRDKIFLEKVVNGNYWVIATQNDDRWLFPHLKLSLNIHKIKTIKQLFNCSGESHQDFILTKAAKVSLMPTGEEWKLEEKGDLEFTASRFVKQRSEIEKVEQKYQELQTELVKRDREQKLLQLKLEKAVELINKYGTEINRLKRKVSDLTQTLESQSSLDPKQQQLIYTYNTNPKNLLNQTIVVSETPNSIDRRQKGNGQEVEFVNNANGIYWIISLEEEHFLVCDRSQFQINEYSLQTIEAMFKYSYDRPGKSQQIELVKPAKVCSSGKNSWRLSEKGVLKFKNDDLAEEIDALDWAEIDKIEIIEEDTPVRVRSIRTLTGHTKAVRSLAISSWNAENTKKILASGSFDQTIKLWELKSGEAIGTLNAGDMVNALALTPDGKTLIANGIDDSLEVWNLYNAKRTTLGEHTDWIFNLVLSLDGKILASGSRDETIKIWDLETQELKQTLTGNSQGALAIAIAPDNKILFSSCGDKTLRVWNLETNTLAATHFQPDLIWSMAITPDGKTLICGSRNSSIFLIDTHAGAVKSTFTGHTGEVWCLAITPDGKTLASGSGDRTIKLWNLDSGALITTLDEHDKEVYTLAIAPDGQTLVSGSRDSTIKIWEL